MMMQSQVGAEVRMRIGSSVLNGDLAMPMQGKSGLVIFAHGSGSSRLSPRNRHVASTLVAAGLGTLLFDLLTETEDENYETRFDIELLTRRLEGATRWVLDNYGSKRAIRIGYFGASTGAAAALSAAAELEGQIAAVVSRGGRPDLASPYLSRVLCPTLFIVGGRDQEVLAMNRSALILLAARSKELVVVPGATHLFEEEGALDQVARHATDWFTKYL
jgi:putative phosphoribosyl transferase